MHRSTTPTRWRVLPTLLVVVSAMGLGAVTARADERPASAAAVHAPAT